MSYYASSSFKLSVAVRASQCQGRWWWPIGLGFAFSAALSFSVSFLPTSIAPVHQVAKTLLVHVLVHICRNLSD